MNKHLHRFRRILLRAISDDVLNTSKAAAYSGMLMLFPGLLLLTTILALAPDSSHVRMEMRNALEQFLPGDTMDLVQAYFQTQHIRPVQVLLSAGGLSLLAGLGMILTLMEGFRRAYRIQDDEDWGFWGRRITALLLIPSCLIPMGFATLLVIFGHSIEIWMIDNAGHELRHVVIFLWRLLRWVIAMSTSTSVLALIYHFGTRRREHWTRILPGAVFATTIWFPLTLIFGWYVTRVADYSILYGSLGTGIATMVWLYLTFIAVLAGAEYNAVSWRERSRNHVHYAQESEPAPVEHSSAP
jgi:membrane protein